MFEQGPEQDERPAPFSMTPTPSLTSPNDRRCPWCGSTETRLVQRGYTGPTDEVNQYFTCQRCKKITYELVAKTAREMRLGRFRTGGIFKDNANQTRYQVSRVLKVGLNEYLIYLKPIVGPDPAEGTVE